MNGLIKIALPQKDTLHVVPPVKIIPCPQFSRIVHLSDIHIPKIKRHDEYRQVFDVLYCQLRNLAQDFVIVITGDVFESKRDFKPETWDLVTEFLSELSSIAYTIVIAGNHDMLERNTTITDSLSPAVKHIDNLYYCKYSGIYRTGTSRESADITFVVSSLYDKLFLRWRDVKDLVHDDDLVVALYHGTISGSRLASGMTLNSSCEGSTRYRSIGDFDGYDAVLLGDIHKYQVMFNDFGKRLCYAGSLIQQNQGESITGHGFAIWQRDERDTGLLIPKHCTIPNQWAHVTLHAKDGRLNLDMLKTDESWKHIYLRVRSVRTPSSVVKHLVKKHLGKTDVVSLSIEHIHSDETEIAGDRKDSSDCLESQDSTPVSAQPTVIQLVEQLSQQYSPDLTEQLIKLHREYAADHPAETVSEYWRPIYMEFKNMFGYGRNIVNRIDFQNGVNCITAANKSGKTSVINTMLFALFGATPLAPATKSSTYDVVNNTASSGYVLLHFMVGSKYYLIQRQSGKQRNGSKITYLNQLKSYTFQLSFHLSDHHRNKITNLLTEKQAGTDSSIAQLVGDLDSFRLMNMVNKESNLSITSMPPATQLKAFKQIFGLHQFDLIKNQNAKRLNTTRKKLSYHVGGLESTNKALEECSIIGSTDELNKKLMEKHSTLNQMKDDIQSNRVRLTQIKQLLIELIHHKTTISQQISKLKELTKKSEICVTSVEDDCDIESVVDDLRTQIAFNQGLISHRMGTHNVLELSKQLEYHLACVRQLETKTPMLVNHRESQASLESQIAIIMQRVSGLDHIVHDEETSVVTNRMDLIKKQIELIDIEHVNGMTHGIDAIKFKLQSLTRVVGQLARFNLVVDRKGIVCDDDIIEALVLEKNNLRDLNIKLDQISFDDCTKPTSGADIDLLRAKIAPIGAIEQLIDVSSHRSVETIQTEMRSVFQTPPAMIIKRLEDLHGEKSVVMERMLLDDVILLLKSGWTRQQYYQELSEELHQTKMVMLNNSRVKLQQEKIKQNKTVQQNINHIVRGKLLRSKQTSEHMIHNLTNALQFRQKSTLLGKYKQILLMLEQNHAKQINLDLLKNQLDCEQKKLTYCSVRRLEQLNEQLNHMACLRKVEHLKMQIAEGRKCDSIRQKIEMLQTRLDGLHQTWLQRLVKSLVLLDPKISELKSNAEQLTNVLKSTQIDMDQIKEDLIRLEESAKSKKKLDSLVELHQGAVDKLTKQLALFMAYDRIISEKGIPTKLMYLKLHGLEDDINYIFSKYTPYRLSVVHNQNRYKDSIKFICHNRSSGHALSCSRLSGFEKMVLEIALKTSFNKYSNISRSSFFMVDEGFDVMDESNFDQLDLLVSQIKEEYSVLLLISQRDLVDVADRQIKIINQHVISI